MKFQGQHDMIQIQSPERLGPKVNPLHFDKPVVVLVGLGFPRMISSVGDAYALLNDWSFGKRCGAHRVALNACKAALLGEIDAETARSTFEAFARRAQIYAPQFTDLIAHQAQKSFQNSGGSAKH